MNKKEAVFLYSKSFQDYSYPSNCPFKTERAFRVRKTLAGMGLLSGSGRKEVAVEPASREILESFHRPEYLDALIDAGNGDWSLDALNMGIGGPDTPVFKGMYEYGALATGAALKGADLLLAGDVHIAFNPAGGLHHAMPALASGFCYINDMAIACRYLANAGKKVLYLDIDVHHGDGVQHAFYSENQVMTISMHETGRMLFPGTGFEHETGTGTGEGYAVNIPLPPETYNEAYYRCYSELVEPLIGAFDPDVIVLELGADGLAGDPLAHLKLSNKVYGQILTSLLGLEKPLLVSGGGGYHVGNTVRAWSYAWCVMTGARDEMETMNLGLGGVMLESTDWMGGFLDKDPYVTEEQKTRVEPEIDAVIRKVKELVFPIHGLE